MSNILSLWIQSFTVGPAKMKLQENGAFQICSFTNTPAEKVLSEDFFHIPAFLHLLPQPVAVFACPSAEGDAASVGPDLRP